MSWCAACGLDHAVAPTRLCITCLAVALATNERESVVDDGHFEPEPEPEHTCPTCELRKTFMAMYPIGTIAN